MIHKLSFCNKFSRNSYRCYSWPMMQEVFR